MMVGVLACLNQESGTEVEVTMQRYFINEYAAPVRICAVKPR